MTVALAGAVCLLAALMLVRERQHAAERARLLNAVIAKNTSEYMALEHERPKKKKDPSDDRVLASQLDNPVGI